MDYLAWNGSTGDEMISVAIPLAIMLGCLLGLIFLVAQARIIHYNWKKKREN